MRAIPESDPVVKATTDREIHDALLGVKNAQLDLTKASRRDGAGAGMTLAFFRAYYEKLPDDVTRRLSEIDSGAVEGILEATGRGLSGESLEAFISKLASPAAFAQVVRAANAYRAKLGFRPLGPDGWPEREEGSA